MKKKRNIRQQLIKRSYDLSQRVSSDTNDPAYKYLTKIDIYGRLDIIRINWTHIIMKKLSKIKRCSTIVCMMVFYSFSAKISFGAEIRMQPRELTVRLSEPPKSVDWGDYRTLSTCIEEIDPTYNVYDGKTQYPHLLNSNFLKVVHNKSSDLQNKVFSSSNLFLSTVLDASIVRQSNKIATFIFETLAHQVNGTEAQDATFIRNFKEKVINFSISCLTPELFGTILPAKEEVTRALNERFDHPLCNGFGNLNGELSAEETAERIALIATDLATYLQTLLSSALYKKMGLDFSLYLNWDNFRWEPICTLTDAIHPRGYGGREAPYFEERLKLDEALKDKKFEKTPPIIQLAAVDLARVISNVKECTAYLAGYPTDLPIFVSLADIHGAEIDYGTIKHTISLLKEVHDNITVVFNGDIERREEPYSSESRYQANAAGCNSTIIETCDKLIIPIKQELGCNVIVNIGNHDIQEVNRFVLALEKLQQAEIPVITNLKNSFNDNFEVVRSPLGQNVKENIALQPMLEHYIIQGDTLVFPYVTAFIKYGGGSISKISFEKLLRDPCHENLTKLYTNQTGTDQRMYPERLLLDGKVNPIVLETAKIFHDALIALNERNPDGRLNLVLATHESPIKTLKFFQLCSVLFPVPKHILDRLSITMMTGHDHLIFDFYTTLQLFGEENGNVLPVDIGCSASGRGIYGPTPHKKYGSYGVMSLHLISDLVELPWSLTKRETGVTRRAGQITPEEKEALLTDAFISVSCTYTSNKGEGQASLADILASVCRQHIVGEPVAEKLWISTIQIDEPLEEGERH
ncbi:MAG: hypothetical protein LBQ43_02815 [Holosporales bacterium]|jgi:hypothetical protein|nr:hypothetical protein [Holosporales bacterium]